VLDEELDKDDLERLFVVAGVQLVCGDGAARTSQSHARLAAIGELDARSLKSRAQLLQGLSVAARTPSLEICDRVPMNSGLRR
jgi:hypothetical protein